MNPLLLASLANIAGGVAGNLLSQGDRDKASAEIEGIKDLYANIQLPDIEQMKLDLQQYQTGPEYNPQMGVAEQLAMQDALQNVQLDPRLKQTQMNTLDVLQKIAGSGFTPDELNALQEQRSAREADLTATLKGQQQQQDMRGIGNSDMALAQRMMEAQGSANRGAADARALEAEAYKRSVDAMAQGANLASNIDATDYARQAQLAQNLNQRELTNLQQRATTKASNLDAFNKSLESNVANVRDTLNKNTALRNQQQQYNKGLAQQQFGNQMFLAGAKAGAAGTAANMYGNRADSTAGMFSGIGSGFGKVAMGMGGNTSGASVDSNKFGIDDVPTLQTPRLGSKGV